jgi:hypothetical protein
MGFALTPQTKRSLVHGATQSEEPEFRDCGNIEDAKAFLLTPDTLI